MSSGRVQRMRCRHCHQPCRVIPLEVMVRGVRGWRGHWMWGQLAVCPACQVALLDQLALAEFVDQELDDAINEAVELEVRSAIAAGRGTKRLASA